MKRKATALLLSFILILGCAYTTMADELPFENDFEIILDENMDGEDASVEAGLDAGDSSETGNTENPEAPENPDNPVKEEAEPEMTSFTVKFNSEIQNALLKVRYCDAQSQWQDVPGKTYMLEESTGTVEVRDFDMAAYGKAVRIVLGDANGVIAETAADAELPMEEIIVDTQSLFEVKLSDDTIAALQNGFSYTGGAIEPAVAVVSEKIAAVDAGFYEVKYSDNVNAGQAAVSVVPKAPFFGTPGAEFIIQPVDLSTADTVVKAGDALYTGQEIIPADLKVTATVDGKTVTLVSGTDFTAEYTNNIEIGTASITIQGQGNFTGTANGTFQITDNTITSVKLKYSSMQYTGEKLKQTADIVVKCGSTVLKYKTDYTVSYKNNINLGTATVTITGKGAYKGTLTATFKITKPVSALTITGIENKVYTGKAIKQNIVVKDGSKTLKLWTDYKVTYTDNVEVGKATVTIKGKGYYTGSVKKTFKITKPISKTTISGVKNMTYTGKAITLKIVIKDGEKQLVKDTDYTVAYANNKALGTATVRIKGKGYYTGSIQKTFKIQKKISSLTISGIKNVTYNGKARIFDIVVKDGTKVLTKGTDYTVTYQNNVNAGTATVTIKGKGNYKGSVIKEFTIRRAKITSATLKYTSMEYTGLKKVQSKTTVVKSGKTVISGENYKITYENNINPGTATMTITGKGNYTGTLTQQFTIRKYKLKKTDIKLEYTEKTYTGKTLKPGVTVTAHYVNKKTAVLTNADYEVTYAENKDAGTAKVTVKGIGDYNQGTVTVTFKIKPVKIGTVTLETKTYTYDGTAKKPAVTVKAEVDGKTITLKKDTNYTLSYLNNTKAGTATAVVKGKGNFDGTVNTTFKIKPAKISSITLGQSSFTYTGSAITPGITVKSGTTVLKNGTDYKVTCTNNINAGTATAKVTGIGNYTGELSKKFTITKKALTTATTINTDTAKVMKNKKDQKYPTVLSVTDNGRRLTEGTDYKISISTIGNYDKQTEETGYITVTGIGNYSGTVQKQFLAMSDAFMKPIDSQKREITSSTYAVGAEPVAELLYKGSVTQKFLLGKDFTVTYSGNTKAGTAYVRIKGKSKTLLGLDKLFSFTIK